MAKVYKTTSFTDFNTKKPVFINPAHVVYITPAADKTLIVLSNGNTIGVISDYTDVEKWLAPHFGYHYEDNEQV